MPGPPCSTTNGSAAAPCPFASPSGGRTTCTVRPQNRQEPSVLSLASIGRPRRERALILQGNRGEGNQLAWYQILHPRVVKDPSITFPEPPSAPAAIRHATPARLARRSNARPQGSARASVATRWFEGGRNARRTGTDMNAEEWGVDRAATTSRARERHADGIVDADSEILVRGS